MAAIQVGRVCIKLKGKDAGEKVIVTKIVDENYVMIKSNSRKNKERKCSILHLEPTETIVTV